jgi:hypothetical protein
MAPRPPRRIAAPSDEANIGAPTEPGDRARSWELRPLVPDHHDNLWPDAIADIGGGVELDLKWREVLFARSRQGRVGHAFYRGFFDPQSPWRFRELAPALCGSRFARPLTQVDETATQLCMECRVRGPQEYQGQLAIALDLIDAGKTRSRTHADDTIATDDAARILGRAKTE